jgi:hypothetical protein
VHAGRVIAVAVVLAVGVGVSTTVAPAQTGGAPRITDTTIRLGVVADVDNAFSPGLFAGSPAAVRAFAQFMNSHGGLAGRHVVVDFYDSHLSPDDARNAMIKACSQDFAVIGTAALFLNNVDDMVGCKDQTGAATGLPDIPIVVTDVSQQCSPVSFAINPSQLVCSTKDQHPQTYRANIGAIEYYKRTRFKSLHGIGVYSNDVKAASVAQVVLIRGANAGGVRADGEFGVSALAPQVGYTSVAQAMRSHNSNYALATSVFASTIDLRKEALLQGVQTNSVVWDCFSPCYDRKFLQQGGSAVESQYVQLAQLPFEESRSNAALANYVKYAGASNVDGFGAYAWIASLLFRDVVNQVVKQGGGNNALTRKALLAGLRTVHAFNADGMWVTTDIAGRVPSPCFLVMQVQHGQFKRVYPSKPGTFDCKPSNRVTIRAELLG